MESGSVATLYIQEKILHKSLLFHVKSRPCKIQKICVAKCGCITIKSTQGSGQAVSPIVHQYKVHCSINEDTLSSQKHCAQFSSPCSVKTISKKDGIIIIIIRCQIWNRHWRPCLSKHLCHQTT